MKWECSIRTLLAVLFVAASIWCRHHQCFSVFVFAATTLYSYKHKRFDGMVNRENSWLMFLIFFSCSLDRFFSVFCFLFLFLFCSVNCLHTFLQISRSFFFASCVSCWEFFICVEITVILLECRDRWKNQAITQDMGIELNRNFDEKIKKIFLYIHRVPVELRVCPLSNK